VNLEESGLSTGILTGTVQIIAIEKKNESPGRVRSGWLTKEGYKRKNWKRRWFVLSQDGKLSYYKEAAEAKPLKILNVAGIKVRKLDHPTKAYCFELSLPKRVFLLCADNNEAVQLWVEDVSKVANSSPLSSSGGLEITAASIVSALGSGAAVSAVIGGLPSPPVKSSASGPKSRSPCLIRVSQDGGGDGNDGIQVQNNPFFRSDEEGNV